MALPNPDQKTDDQDSLSGNLLIILLGDLIHSSHREQNGNCECSVSLLFDDPASA
jgi:hypothetical protein